MRENKSLPRAVLSAVCLIIQCGMLSLSSSQTARATEGYRASRKHVSIGLAAQATALYRASTNERAQKGVVNSVLPSIELGVQLGPLSLRGGGMPFGLLKAGDAAAKKTYFFVDAIYNLSLIGLTFRAGPGVWFYQLSGSGGTVDLNNGSSTATFYRPDYSSTSRQLYIDLGLGFPLWGSSFSIDFDAWIFGALSSRRTVSAMMSLVWGVF